jgi:hypothetical protein
MVRMDNLGVASTNSHIRVSTLDKRGPLVEGTKYPRVSPSNIIVTTADVHRSKSHAEHINNSESHAEQSVVRVFNL